MHGGNLVFETKNVFLHSGSGQIFLCAQSKCATVERSGSSIAPSDLLCVLARRLQSASFNTPACISFCKPCCIVWGYFLATRSLSRLSDTEALPRAPRALSTQTRQPSVGDVLSLRFIASGVDAQRRVPLAHNSAAEGLLWFGLLAPKYILEKRSMVVIGFKQYANYSFEFDPPINL